MSGPDGHDTVRMNRLRIKAMLHKVGLRATRTRLALAELVFGKGHRHLSAETLHAEAVRARVPVALSTVYNTLHEFTGAGLLRQAAVGELRSYFDTNLSAHHHFFFEDDRAVVDIPLEEIGVECVAEPPPGYAVSRVDVVVRLRGIDSAQQTYNHRSRRRCRIQRHRGGSS